MYNYNYLLQKKQNDTFKSHNVERYIDKILENEYYTESGPLLLDVERRVGELIGSKHVIGISNPSIAWLLLLEAEGFRGKEILVTKNINANALSAMRWIGCKPKLLDLQTNKIISKDDSKEIYLEKRNNYNVLLTNKFSGLEDFDFAKKNKNINLKGAFVDSSESFMCKFLDREINPYVKAEIYSFENTGQMKNEFSSLITTNSDYLADYLRCMRGSGGVINKVKTIRTANARMSEGQAAFMLSFLDNIREKFKNNSEIYQIYYDSISSRGDYKILSAKNTSSSNSQNFVFVAENKILESCLFKNAEIAGLDLNKVTSNNFFEKHVKKENVFVLPIDICTVSAKKIASKLFK